MAVLLAGVLHGLPSVASAAQELTPIEVEGQPLAANVKRLLDALVLLGAPLPVDAQAVLKEAVDSRDAAKIQKALDPHVLLAVHVNPESRVKVSRGPANAVLQEAGFTPIVVKVFNDSTVTKALRISSPQAGPVYSGVALLSMTRQDQLHLRENENLKGDKWRFLHLEMFDSQPMTATLSGLKVEYALALVYSLESGKREATIGFDVGQGTQDLGFRGEVPVLFNVRPAVPIKLSIKDHDGTPTTGRFTFRDATGRVYPPQPKRLAPDLFFQQHVYRHDGETVLLPPGAFTMYFSRGPEYRQLRRQVTIKEKQTEPVAVRLERWIEPAAYGYYSGDHHIHAAGCAHY